MRDKNRIVILLNKFKELWEMFPDLRFIQVIYLVFEYPALKGIDVFFVEEDVWLKAIQFAIDKYSK